MKKILFISYYYYPDNVIGAIRPTKLLKYLSKNFGCNCDILTFENHTKKDENDRIETFYTNKFVVPIFKNKKNNEEKQKNNVEYGKKKNKKKNYFIIKIRKTARNILNLLYEYKLFFKAKKYIENIDIKVYDVIFSTFNPETNHFIARYIKKKNKKAIWIADFRDPVYNPLFSSFLFKKYEKRFVNNICKSADYYTVVSKGYSKALYIQKHDKISVVYNGFDPDDYTCSTVNTKFDKFTLTTVGNLYNGFRDVRPVIKCLHELIKENKVDINNIKFVYAGTDYQLFYNHLEEYNMGFLLNSLGFIDRDESLLIQKKSHILLLPTWNYDNYEGVIPGKFFEYLLSGVPIVALVTGNKANSEISELIDRTNSGMCYEAANHHNDYTILKNTILEYYEAFLDNSITVPKLNVLEVEKFDYSNISKEIYSLINQSVKK